MNTPDKNSPTEQTSKKYTFAQRDGDDFSCIKLLEDPYKDVIFHYGKVGVGPKENENGTMNLVFDYTIVQNPGKINIDKQQFIDYIGDILVEILDERYGNEQQN